MDRVKTRLASRAQPTQAMIPYNKPYLTGNEFAYIKQSIENGHLSGNGVFTKTCHRWLESNLGARKCFLTQSGTTALEMAAILADVQLGDEVIMPSFTFVTTATSFVLRGATPVFVDIRPDTLNLDEKLIRQAITEKTKVIVPVHYAGVSCNMDEITKIAEERELLIVEDAAHALLSTYMGQPVGSRGHFSALSFHETKNVISGEGGVLAINDDKFLKRAQIVWEKGTNREEFFLGEVDKYTWIDLGSSFPPSEVTAAFLWAQLEQAESITKRRVCIWEKYYQGLADLEARGYLKRPARPDNCTINGHIFHFLVSEASLRNRLLEFLKERGVHAVFHYVPLHSSPAGLKFGRASANMVHTDSVSARIVRLPIWADLTDEMIERVLLAVHACFGH